MKPPKKAPAPRPEPDIPLDDDEEVLGQRYDAEADVLIVVTSHGRKLVIGPDGSVTVLSGPPITPRD